MSTEKVKIDEICQQIYWYSESMHSARQMMRFIIESGKAGEYEELETIGRYKGQPKLMTLIFYIFRFYAEARIAHLQLTEDHDCLLTPVVHPHLLVNHCYSRKPVFMQGIRSTKIGAQLGFTVWDGDNAPLNLKEWTGTVVRKQPMFTGGPIEYILKRDADGQFIKLSRDFLIPLQSE